MFVAWLCARFQVGRLVRFSAVPIALLCSGRYGNLRSGDDELVVSLTPLNASFNRLAVESGANVSEAVVFGVVENVGVGLYHVT